MRKISTTYAYHPANEKADLKLATEAVARYVATEQPDRRRIDLMVENDIAQNGVQSPLLLKTNGTLAVLADGHVRIAIARKLGIKKLPVQIVPDNFRRMRHHGGYAPLDTALSDWVRDNLWSHEGHDVVRHVVGGGPGSITANKYAKCECSCGAHWKEEA